MADGLAMTQQSLCSSADGSAELSKPYHERTAHYLSLGYTQWDAAKSAARDIGRNADLVTAPNARKLCQKQHIKDRVAHLRQQEQRIWEEKRRMLEERQWLVHDSDIGEFYEVVEEPWLDRNGEVIRDAEGNPLLRKRERPRPLSSLPRDLRLCVESLSFTDSGKINLRLYSKADANRELRKLNGIDVAPSIAEGDEGISRMSDEELHEALGRQARELGINVTLSYEGASG